MLKNFMVLLVGATIVLSSVAVRAEELTAVTAKAKAIAAADLVKAEGVAAFDKLKDPNGDFSFANGEGYVWVHNLDNMMVMHPKKPSLDGTMIADMRDKNGVYLFVAMNEVAEEHGAGWVTYAWPKPGAEDTSPKASYVVLAEKDGASYVVGCGLYDVTLADIQGQFPEDPYYE